MNSPASPPPSRQLCGGATTVAGAASGAAAGARSAETRDVTAGRLKFAWSPCDVCFPYGPRRVTPGVPPRGLIPP